MTMQLAMAMAVATSALATGDDSCWETALLAATSLSGATALPPPGSAVPTATVPECRAACCAAELCVAWSLDSLERPGDQCSLFATRGVLARANRSSLVSSYRAMSVPPDASWSWSWDTVPLYSHSCNTSGAYNSGAVANLTSKRWGMGLITLDWEVNYTATAPTIFAGALSPKRRPSWRQLLPPRCWATCRATWP